ncbi:MAG TPA: cell envelope integrity protein CreD [Lacunisphaera sp.]|nr:cell envelope integrity protein CreD [Lacunisphaera sp.]
MNAEPPVMPTPAARRLAVFLKVGFICLLIPMLVIPLAMTNGVLHERQGYRAQAAREIAAIWGRQQLVTGPVLAVPYGYRTTVIRPKVVAGRKVDVEESELVSAVAYFLPENLAIQGAVDPETRHRGIYDVVVYTATLKLTGTFAPDFAAAGIAADQVSWDKAEVLLGVSDLRGVRAVSPVTITPSAGPGPGGPRSLPFESADGAGSEGLSLAAKTDGAVAAGKVEFALEAVLQGSERLDFVPAGRTTQVDVRSPWANPSFGGAYLPAKRTVGTAGFTAEWEVSHFSRGFGQSWTSRGAEAGGMAKKFVAAGFGVAFAQPVNAYSMVERAQKYGVLFFVLVFAVFFLFEVTARLRIHPLQYAMVGAALCLFFLGFLALAEFWSMAAAYGAAAAACTLLVALYAWTFLRSGARTLVIGGGLAATYGYLYFVLQSEDYALVAGTVALFAALALVMFCTRRINWYALDLPGTENAGAGVR